MPAADNVQLFQATEHVTQKESDDQRDVLHKSQTHPGKCLFITLSCDDNIQD